MMSRVVDACPQMQHVDGSTLHASYLASCASRTRPDGQWKPKIKCRAHLTDRLSIGGYPLTVSFIFYARDSHGIRNVYANAMLLKFWHWNFIYAAGPLTCLYHNPVLTSILI